MNCSVLRRRIRRSVDIHFSLLLCDRSGRRLLDHCRVTFFLLCRRISHSRFLLLASGQQRKAGEQTNVFFHTPYSYFSAKFGRLSGRNIPVAGDLRLGMSFAAALRASRKIAVAASLRVAPKLREGGCEAPHAVNRSRKSHPTAPLRR